MEGILLLITLLTAFSDARLSTRYLGYGVHNAPITELLKDEEEGYARSPYLGSVMRGVPLLSGDNLEDDTSRSGYLGLGVRRGAPLPQHVYLQDIHDEDKQYEEKDETYIRPPYFRLEEENSSPTPKNEELEDTDKTQSKTGYHGLGVRRGPPVPQALKLEDKGEKERSVMEYHGLGFRGAQLDNEEDEDENRINSLIDELEIADQKPVEARPFQAKPLFRGKKTLLPRPTLYSGIMEKIFHYPLWFEQPLKRDDESKVESVVLPWKMNYFSPMLRGKKATMFPILLKQLMKRDPENYSTNGTPQLHNVVLPWEMNYFSPMLRGK